MRLSTAIREGSKVRPQNCGGGYFSKNGEVRSCALGAAYEALGNSPTLSSRVNDALYATFSAEFEHVVACPQLHCDSGLMLLRTMIVHLNDIHFWSRERIADWVQSIEDKES
jgi:hypothetical protein